MVWSPSTIYVYFFLIYSKYHQENDFKWPYLERHKAGRQVWWLFRDQQIPHSFRLPPIPGQGFGQLSQDIQGCLDLQEIEFVGWRRVSRDSGRTCHIRKAKNMLKRGSLFEKDIRHFYQRWQHNFRGLLNTGLTSNWTMLFFILITYPKEINLCLKGKSSTPALWPQTGLYHCFLNIGYHGTVGCSFL